MPLPRGVERPTLEDMVVGVDGGDGRLRVGDGLPGVGCCMGGHSVYL